MYVPAHFAAPTGLLATLLGQGRLADVITYGPDGLDATPVPLILSPDGGSLQGHLARNNPQWRADGAPALVIVRGPDAYVSPVWYEATREHGRVVPTWNYQLVHVHGRLVAHDDPGWTGDLVGRLTDLHEAGLDPRWRVADAPSTFIAGQLRGIVGIEVTIERVEAKSKMSQNRPAADRLGVMRALGAGSADQRAVARVMSDEAEPVVP
ncbi:MAG: FMN-binding negative transcriptional regulator [Actinobacteria bacterium]|nr:FMN-binding negative transcriptional regulator [Actinomycetota bacterium]